MASQFANMMGMVRMSKTWRLFHDGFLIKNTMKKSIFKVKLSNWPSKRNSNGTNNTCCSSPNNRTKSLIILNTWLLVKTLCYRPIRFIFNTIHRFTTNQVHIIVRRNEHPSFIFQMSIKFIYHYLLPFWIFDIQRERRWFTFMSNCI